MKCFRKFVLIGCLAFALLIGSGCAVHLRPVSDGRTKGERKQIAEALLAMLHSSLTNEIEITADNAAVPEVIRALRPVDIELAGSDAVVICAGKPAEYHLSRQTDDPKTWILYVAGPGYLGHREILRIKRD
jgi:hypothetical protein